MELIWQGLVEAVRLLLAGDPGVLEITWLSIKISGTATALSLFLGIPAGVALAPARAGDATRAVSGRQATDASAAIEAASRRETPRIGGLSSAP